MPKIFALLVQKLNKFALPTQKIKETCIANAKNMKKFALLMQKLKKLALPMQKTRQIDD